MKWISLVFVHGLAFAAIVPTFEATVNTTAGNKNIPYRTAPVPIDLGLSETRINQLFPQGKRIQRNDVAFDLVDDFDRELGNYVEVIWPGVGYNEFVWVALKGLAVDPVTTTTVKSTTTTTVTISTTSTTTVGSTTSTTLISSGPRRIYASGDDINIDIPRKYRCKYMDMVTADQGQRAAMYLKGVATMMPEGLLYVKYNPYCTTYGGMSKSRSDYETESKRLRVYYVDRQRNSTWAVLGDNGCPDYEHTNDLGKRIRECSTRSEVRKIACGQSEFLSPDLLAWTRMIVVNGKCEKMTAKLSSFPEEDMTMAIRGLLNFRVPLNDFTPTQRKALEHLLHAHHAADLEVCTGKVSTAGSVKVAVENLISSAPDEFWEHASLLEFTRINDPEWTRQQKCDWKQLEGLALEFWGRCVDVKPEDRWACLQSTRVTHESLHACAAFRNDKLNIRINNHITELKLTNQINPNTKTTQLTSQPSKSCLEWLECLTQPACLPWVPDPSTWRILTP